MVEDPKAAKQRRLAEALRANLKRRKAAARARAGSEASEAPLPRPEGAVSPGRSEAGGEKD